MPGEREDHDRSQDAECLAERNNLSRYVCIIITNSIIRITGLIDRIVLQAKYIDRLTKLPDHRPGSRSDDPASWRSWLNGWNGLSAGFLFCAGLDSSKLIIINSD